MQNVNTQSDGETEAMATYVQHVGRTMPAVLFLHYVLDISSERLYLILRLESVENCSEKSVVNCTGNESQ